MSTVSIEIPDTLNLKLVEAARRLGSSKIELISEALEEYLARQEQIPSNDSFAALAAEILDSPGDESGPSDLSINKKHLDGYGQ
ncbi:MAG: hypothetical protein JMDDDDMK_01073 [Acidobacteria bacterium]|nr:hypothetical protein [Acidobacteriota bacterium]